jgi:hypothetical protein
MWWFCNVCLGGCGGCELLRSACDSKSDSTTRGTGSGPVGGEYPATVQLQCLRDRVAR